MIIMKATAASCEYLRVQAGCAAEQPLLGVATATRGEILSRGQQSNLSLKWQFSGTNQTYSEDFNVTMKKVTAASCE